MIDRRGFLALSAIAAVGACSSPSQRDSMIKVANVEFTPAEADVDLGGVTVKTWAYGGQVPGKEIRIRKGQSLRAPVTNKLPGAGTTIHWHGIAIRNDMDGVPVLTQQEIGAGQQFTYEFTVPDSGTYYYHSHVGTQLDRGLQGPLIVEDPSDGTDYDDELVVMLDDWIDGTGTTPELVLENLRKSGMKPMQDTPMAGVGPTTPLGSDGGDVTYPHYLINGHVKTNPQVKSYRAGQRIRLRIIGAGADTAFRVALPDTPMTITHTDGYPVVARQADSVILGMGERVDATVTLKSSVPVIAAAEGKDGYARMDLRVNDAPVSTNVDAFVTTLRAMAPVNTANLLAAPNVQLPQRDPDKTLEMRLAGPRDGYNWPINGILYNPPNNGMPVSAGQRVRVRLTNESMMFHPIHLHGHTFQVMQDAGPAARKDTVLVPPLETVDFEFDTNNPGRWITHCHNDYHLESGMATFIYYT
jgi:multicopper oxidase